MNFYTQPTLKIKAGYTTFVFDETNEMNELVKSYYSGAAMIEPVQHARSIKNLKSLIHPASISTSKE